MDPLAFHFSFYTEMFLEEDKWHLKKTSSACRNLALIIEGPGKVCVYVSVKDLTLVREAA